MRTSELYEIEIWCRELAEQTGSLVSWEWDDKFLLLQAKITSKDKKTLFRTLKSCFDSLWSSKTLKRAPAAIKAIVETLGGIKEGQYMFFSNPELDIRIYSAWWPWATGDRFTIRLGIITQNMTDDDSLKIKRLFRTWFGL
jgi:hypothetical protein